MTLALRQSTASQEIPLGYFVDSTDGNTEETGLTIANTDIKLWKNGATTLANKNSGGGTHISNGIYYAVLDATDTDTIGPLVVFVHVSGALAVRVECCVYDEPVFDALFAAAGYLPVDVGKISGDATAADNCELMFDGTGYAGGTTKLDVNAATIANGAITAAAVATGAIDDDAIAAGAIASTAFAAGAITASAIAADAIGASELAADAVAEIADAVWDEATAGHTGAGSAGKALIDALADTNELQTDLVNGGRLDLLIDAITSELAKVPKSDSTVSFNATALAAIADKVLGRAIAGSADGGRTVSQALASLRNKVAISGSTMTVYAADDATSLWTATLTTDAGGAPIVTIDPA